jgi:rubrerythrin
MIEGFTAIRSMSGTEGALKAMRSNEKTTTQTYQKAQGLQVSDEIKVLLRRNWEDEERHLHYIEQVLAERPWQTDARKVG